ncbi:MAG TPA: helix-turn-helix transcriptional regulator [Clostridiaceae bacterium]|nr:helix-turn-helix transcriptional regulator [Clostridiaceae bacterium]
MIDIGQDMISSFDIIRRISGDKWKFLIITHLFNGKRRFGELLYEIDNISNKVLSENLRELEKLGIVYRISYDEAVPRVEYSLTKIGCSLLPVFKSLIVWSLNYSDAYKKQMEILNDTNNII